MSMITNVNIPTGKRTPLCPVATHSCCVAVKKTGRNFGKFPQEQISVKSVNLKEVWNVPRIQRRVSGRLKKVHLINS